RRRTGRANDCRGDVPCHGDDILAGEGGGGSWPEGQLTSQRWLPGFSLYGRSIRPAPPAAPGVNAYARLWERIRLRGCGLLTAQLRDLAGHQELLWARIPATRAIVPRAPSPLRERRRRIGERGRRLLSRPHQLLLTVLPLRKQHFNDASAVGVEFDRAHHGHQIRLRQRIARGSAVYAASAP